MENESLAERFWARLEKIRDYVGKYSGKMKIGLEERRQREMDYFVLCRQAALIYYNRNCFRNNRVR